MNIQKLHSHPTLEDHTFSVSTNQSLTDVVFLDDPVGQSLHFKE